MADGHKNITWTKGGDHKNAFDANTSEFVAYYPTLATDVASAVANYDTNLQSDITHFHQVLQGTPGYGKFITAGTTGDTGYNQWYNPTYSTNAHYNYLWGQSTQHQTSNRSPAKNGNDPCPQGWKVSSWWDISDDNGTGDPVSSNYTNDKNNDRVRRLTTNNAIGGALIINANGEMVFLPVTG